MHAYQQVEMLLDAHANLDFIEIITDSSTHVDVIKRLIAHKNYPRVIITQKPISPTYLEAKEIVSLVKSKQKILLVHENWHSY